METHPRPDADEVSDEEIPDDISDTASEHPRGTKRERSDHGTDDDTRRDLDRFDQDDTATTFTYDTDDEREAVWWTM